MRQHAFAQQAIFRKTCSTAKSWITLSSFLVFTTSVQISSVEIRSPQIVLSPRVSSQIEGSICADCGTRTPQATNLVQLAQINGGTEQIFNAAYFNDNGERSTLVALRNRRALGETLSIEERAILQAGDRVGIVRWPNCINATTNQAIIGNAFLVQLDGQDAIMTSAHLIRSKSQVLHGNCDLDDYSTAQYLPNAGYLDHTGPGSITADQVFSTVDATVDPRFGGFSGGTSDENDDWMILFLDQQISSLPAPNQTSPRGFVQFSTPQTPLQRNESYIFGVDDKQEAGTTTFQKCLTVVQNEMSYNSCDTYKGSSGSLVGVLENGEMKFQSINNRNSDLINIERFIPLPGHHEMWNQGLSSEYIYSEIQRILNPNGIDI